MPKKGQIALTQAAVISVVIASIAGVAVFAPDIFGGGQKGQQDASNGFLPPTSAVYCKVDSDCKKNKFCDFSGCDATVGKCVPIPKNCPPTKSVGIGDCKGDLNGDGVIDEDDLDLMTQVIEKSGEVNIDQNCADFNSDGIVDENDIICMNLLLTDLNIYELMSCPIFETKNKQVCGCDGISYANDCERKKARVALNHTGVCGGYCGDGVCSGAETKHSCPEDCDSSLEQTCAQLGGTICSLNQECVCTPDGPCINQLWLDASDTDRCCSQLCFGSPFCGNGFCDIDNDEDYDSCPEDCPQTLDSTCEELEGVVCGDDQICLSEARQYVPWYVASDSNRCCVNGNCVDTYCGDGVCDASDGETFDSCPEDCEDIGKILLAVDSNFKLGLTSELEQWKEDVEAETGQEVEIKGFEPSLTYSFNSNKGQELPVFNLVNAKSVQNYIEENYNDLEGVLFVGNIIPPKIEISNSNNELSDPILSDFYFEDFDGKCFSKKIDKSYSFKDMLFEPDDVDECNSAKRKLWMGRLTPNSDNDLQELKDYFKRNHDYRIGNLVYADELIAYLPMYYGCYYPDQMECSVSDYLEKIQELKESSEIIFPNTVILPFKESQAESDEDFLERVSEERFQMFIYNGHGSSKSMQLLLSPSKIEEYSPKPLYANLLSCGVGDFSEKDYISGRFLFSGDTLAVQANTVPIYVIDLFDIEDLFSLYSGSTFAGNIRFRNNLLSLSDMINLNTHFLGDPTLSMFNKPEKTMLEISPKEIDFGDIPCFYDPLNRKEDCPSECSQRVQIEIKNVGNKEAQVYFESSNAGDLSIMSVTENPTKIAPHSSLTISVETALCSPSFHKGPIKGTVAIIGNTEEIIDYVNVTGNVI